MDQIPPELQETIIGYLDLKSFSRLSRTCTHFACFFGNDFQALFAQMPDWIIEFVDQWTCGIMNYKLGMMDLYIYLCSTNRLDIIKRLTNTMNIIPGITMLHEWDEDYEVETVIRNNKLDTLKYFLTFEEFRDMFREDKINVMRMFTYDSGDIFEFYVNFIDPPNREQWFNTLEYYDDEGEYFREMLVEYNTTFIFTKLTAMNIQVQNWEEIMLEDATLGDANILIQILNSGVYSPSEELVNAIFTTCIMSKDDRQINNIKKLIESCMGVDLSYENDFLLRAACGEGYIDIVEMLMVLDVDVNILNGSPVKGSIDNNHLDILELLLNNVDIQSPEENNIDYFEFAINRKNLKAVRMLEQYNYGYPGFEIVDI